MILDAPWILELGVRLLEPLYRFQSIFSSTNESNNALWVVASRIINSLKEDIVQAVNDSAMFSGSPRDLVDRFKSDLLALASQFGSNLLPKLSKPFFNSRYVRAGLRKIGPSPGIVMNINNRIQPSVCDHVHNIRYTLQPYRIHGTVW